MRAYFYFRLAKFSAEFLLLQKTDGDRTVPRASYTETFAQIQHCSPVYGHANKWVEAIWLRVYLFYTGYMTNIENKQLQIYL
jgi:hypothetical protein